jgi:hypothetical protein
MLDAAVVVAAREQISCDLADEVAILNFGSGVYYGLDAVGALIWSLIQQPQTVGAIRDALLDAYDVDPERCDGDLRAFLTELASAGLVEVTDAQRR